MSACKLFCSLLGKDCIGGECAQYNATAIHRMNCDLYSRAGQFLYAGTSLVEAAAFVRYIEEIRPKEIRKEIKHGM